MFVNRSKTKTDALLNNQRIKTDTNEQNSIAGLRLIFHHHNYVKDVMA